MINRHGDGGVNNVEGILECLEVFSDVSMQGTAERGSGATSCIP